MFYSQKRRLSSTRATSARELDNDIDAGNFLTWGDTRRVGWWYAVVSESPSGTRLLVIIGT